MGKTKAEIIAEYRDLKKENLKLNNQLEHWKAIARKENVRVVDLASELDGKSKELVKWTKASREYEETIAGLCTELDECQKEKTLIKSQRDVLLKEAEEHLYQINDLQESFDILQAEVRKIQINEEVIHDHAYEDGYADAEYKYKEALEQSNKELKKFIEHNMCLEWVVLQIYENQTK